MLQLLPWSTCLSILLLISYVLTATTLTARARISVNAHIPHCPLHRISFHGNYILVIVTSLVPFLNLNGISAQPNFIVVSNLKRT